jgi:hypothetical protein
MEKKSLTESHVQDCKCDKCVKAKKLNDIFSLMIKHELGGTGSKSKAIDIEEEFREI